MTKVVAILPMKANSERVKGKNFKDFCGKPLCKWIIDTLDSMPMVDTILINTDARDILESHGIVTSGKVQIRDRAEELCGDEVSMNLIIQDDISAVDADIYLMTHVTNPLLSASTMEKALSQFTESLDEERSDSLFSVNKVQTRFYREDCSPVNHDPDNLIPTQDLEPWYEENSNLYLFTKDSFAKTSARIGATPEIFITPTLESFDIDTPDDWELAVVGAKHLLGAKS